VDDSESTERGFAGWERKREGRVQVRMTGMRRTPWASGTPGPGLTVGQPGKAPAGRRDLSAGGDCLVCVWGGGEAAVECGGQSNREYVPATCVPLVPVKAATLL
jgi:hypothetical protein